MEATKPKVEIKGYKEVTPEDIWKELERKEVVKFSYRNLTNINLHQVIIKKSKMMVDGYPIKGSYINMINKMVELGATFYLKK